MPGTSKTSEGSSENISRIYLSLWVKSFSTKSVYGDFSKKIEGRRSKAGGSITIVQASSLFLKNRSVSDTINWIRSARRHKTTLCNESGFGWLTRGWWQKRLTWPDHLESRILQLKGCPNNGFQSLAICKLYRHMLNEWMNLHKCSRRKRQPRISFTLDMSEAPGDLLSLCLKNLR